jgi:hypothetical protein
MFAKLTSMRVSRQTRSGLRTEPLLVAAPTHANDNHAARGGGATRRSALTCRWVGSATGGLECRWDITSHKVVPDGAPWGAQTPVAMGGRPLALVTG